MEEEYPSDYEDDLEKAMNAPQMFDGDQGFVVGKEDIDGKFNSEDPLNNPINGPSNDLPLDFNDRLQEILKE
jgi:hypothetical protein